MFKNFKKIFLIFIIFNIFLFINFKISQAETIVASEIKKETGELTKEIVIDKIQKQEDQPDTNHILGDNKTQEQESIKNQIEIKNENPIITELLPKPETESTDEFIELFNPSNQEIDLFKWKIRDTHGAVKTYIFLEQTKIKAKDFLVIYRKNITPKIILNDDADSIEFLDDQDKIIFSTPIYSNAKTGKSFSKINNGNNDQDWQWQMPTPGIANQYLEIQPENTEVKPNEPSEQKNILAPLINEIGEILLEQKLTSASIIFQATIGVTINEIVSNPLKNEKEWIELYNFTEQEININGWTIEDGINQKTFLTGIIKAKDFLIIEDPKGALNNNGDIIVLKNKDGFIIDQMSYGKWNDKNISDNAPAPNRGQSIIRLPDGQDTNIDKNDWQITITPTKGKINLLEKEQISLPVVSNLSSNSNSSPVINLNIIYSNQIIVNEILPDPKGNDQEEWIELFNQGDQDVNLANWSLDDQEQGSEKYIIPLNTIILKQGYLIFKKNQTKIILNNDQDRARLFDPNNQLKSEVFYEKVESGQSYSRMENGKWEWAKTLTPGYANIQNSILIKKENIEIQKETQFQNPNDKKEYEIKEQENQLISNDNLSAKGDKLVQNPNNKKENEIKKQENTVPNLVSLKEVRKIEEGKKVKVKGVVSCVPGILGSQIFYLAGSGIQVYLYDKNFLALSLGDEIEIQGELSSYQNETRINLSSKEDIKVLQKNQLINLEKLTLNKINENTEGYLVKIKGKVVETSGDTFYLIDETNKKIKIYIKKSTNIKKPRMQKGDQVEITGIVSQSGEEYRILPRFQEDIKLEQNQISQPKDSHILGENVKTQNAEEIKKTSQPEGDRFLSDTTTQEQQFETNDNLVYPPISGLSDKNKSSQNLNNKKENEIKKQEEKKSEAGKTAATAGVGASATLAIVYRKQIFLFLAKLFLKK